MNCNSNQRLLTAGPFSILTACIGLWVALVCFGPATADAQDPDKTILVHYMPWYASKEFSGKWGWHWTMNKFDPDKRNEKGLREIASHYHPLIGAYDSNDPHALECHLQLMKLAGIHGVVIDWYGTKDANDYAMLHRNTMHLIKLCRQAKLKFAICYEDQSVKHMVRQKTIKPEQAVAVGRESFQWMDSHWFGDPLYVKVADKPLLMVFGPQYFEKEQWPKLRQGLKNEPAIFSLPHVQEKYALDGAFGWAPAFGGKPIAFETWNGYLDRLYARPNHDSLVAVAFPGFVDIYDQAGVQPTHGSISHDQGKTLRHTFERALNSKSKIIQIATWNDFGEGTIIEPTHEHGYRDLEYLQTAIDIHSPYTAGDLKLPVELYLARKQAANNEGRLALLATVSTLVSQGQCEQAQALLDSVAGQ